MKENVAWMKESIKMQTAILNNQTEMLNKQTELIGELKNIIVEESRLTRESLQHVLLKISEQIAGIPEKTVMILKEEKIKL